MEKSTLIPLQPFCNYHNIEISFFHTLQNLGLIEIITEEESAFLPEENLSEVEQYVRLNKELEINIEGIDAITHLLQKVKNMQAEIVNLKTRLSLYEVVE